VLGIQAKARKSELACVPCTLAQITAALNHHNDKIKQNGCKGT